MKLVDLAEKYLEDNACKWYKMATVQFWILVGVAAQLAEIILPYSGVLSAESANLITLLSVTSIALRLYKQKNMPDK